MARRRSKSGSGERMVVQGVGGWTDGWIGVLVLLDVERLHGPCSP